MVVVCLFLNFVPMCKFLFEKQFLCNTNLLYCVTLLSMCVFQRLGRVGWGVIFSFLNNYFSHCFRLNHLYAFSFLHSSCLTLQSTYCSIWMGHANPLAQFTLVFVPFRYILLPSWVAVLVNPEVATPPQQLPLYPSIHLCHCANWSNQASWIP